MSPSRFPVSASLRGILMMVLAIGLFSLMDSGLKLLAERYPPFQVATLRGLASLPLVLLVLLWIALSTGFGTLLRVPYLSRSGQGCARCMDAGLGEGCAADAWSVRGQSPSSSARK